MNEYNLQEKLHSRVSEIVKPYIGKKYSKTVKFLLTEEISELFDELNIKRNFEINQLNNGGFKFRVILDV